MNLFVENSTPKTINDDGTSATSRKTCKFTQERVLYKKLCSNNLVISQKITCSKTIYVFKIVFSNTFGHYELLKT